MLKRVFVLLFCVFLAAPVWAAQEFVLTDIVIEGNKRVQASDVLNAIKIKPGQTVVNADIDEAMAAIYAMGRFEDISADISGDEGSFDTGEVDEPEDVGESEDQDEPEDEDEPEDDEDKPDEDDDNDPDSEASISAP